MADFTKYVFNNKEYGKGKLVLAVVGQYITDNNADYSSLLVACPIPEYGIHLKLRWHYFDGPKYVDFFV